VGGVFSVMIQIYLLESKSFKQFLPKLSTQQMVHCINS